MKIRSIFAEYPAYALYVHNHVFVNHRKSVLVKRDACCCRIYGHVSMIIRGKWHCRV